MKSLTVLALLIVALPLFAQDSIDQRIAKIQAANAVLESRFVFPKKDDPLRHYRLAQELAENLGTPLIVFTGTDVRKGINPAITCAVPKGTFASDGLDGKCIVIAKPHPRGGMTWVATLPAEATDQQIRIAAGLEVQPAVAAPFSEMRPSTAEGDVSGMVDALDEVNAARAARGLSPFARCPLLTAAAQSAAQFRAGHRIAGHTPNDFAHVPSGGSASVAGCAAWPPELGWGACATYESWTYAGASYAIGPDGRRYMHLFCR